MRAAWVVGVVAIAGACQRKTGGAPAVNAPTAQVPATLPAATTALGAMPDFPAATAGAIRLVSSGPDDLAGRLAANAGLCDDPGVLLVQSEQQGFGVLIVLALPAPSARVGRYPVTYSVSGPATLPNPPAAQIALQRVTARALLGFQALEGNVEIYGLGTRVSGRFQVTVREINADRMNRLAGSFSEIPVQRQPASYCAQLARSAADSSRVPQRGGSR